MKNTVSINSEVGEDMLEHYDFSNGVQGNYLHLLEQDQQITIHHEDGTKTIRIIPAPIHLDDDIREYFPNSKAVNDALRQWMASKHYQSQPTNCSTVNNPVHATGKAST